MSDDPSIDPPVSRRRAWRWLGAAAALIVVVVLAAVGALYWAVHDATGTALLLRWAPQVTVAGARGSLLGDFSAERIDVAIPGSGVVRLDAPRWHALAASRGSDDRWLHLRIDTLHADRLTWLAGPPTSPSTPASAPRTLRLPIEIEVREASVDELRIGADGAPIRSLRARVHLGADGGVRHRFDDLGALYDRGRATGSAAIASDAPFAVAAQVSVSATDTTLPWQAALAISGPLDALAVTGRARVAASAGRAAQALDARAVVRPFAAWPLGELQASTEALDLAVFASAAPATSLSGHAVVTTSGVDRPAIISVDLANARPGRWNDGRLPVVRAVAELRARPDTPDVIEVRTLSADLGAGDRAGGRIVAHGRWTQDRWTVDGELKQVRPSALDARAPDTSLDGTVSLVGSGFAGATSGAAVEIVAQLAGQIEDRRLPKAAPRAARLRLEARAGIDAIDLRVAEASLGAARASATGRLARSAGNAPWRASGKARLIDFDPAPWWPGSTDSPLAHGVNRLNAQVDVEIALPASSAALASLDAIAATRGKVALALADSTLAGVPLSGKASFVNDDGRARTTFEIAAAGNRASGHGQLAAADGSDDWRLEIDAPALAALAPWLRGGDAKSRVDAVSGTLTAKAHVEGRWPLLRVDGELHGADVRYGALVVHRAEGRWQLGTRDGAPLDGNVALDGMTVSGRAIEHAALRVSGTARAHRAELRVESAALPPEWADALAARLPSATVVAVAAAAASASVSPSMSAAVPPSTPASAVASSTASTNAANTASAAARSTVVVGLEGGLVDVGAERNAGWRGSVHDLVARSIATPSRTWLRAHDLRGSVLWAGGPVRASVEPGAIEALGATAHWSRVEWQGADASGHAGRLDAQATIDPLPVAPLLRAVQPDFGWGGDLTVGARIDVRSAPGTVVDVVVERAGGDLTVTDEIATQKLGFTDLRLGIAARDGVWNFTAGIAGTTLGVASAAVVARTGSSASWPDAATPIEGVLQLDVAKLAAWGTWVPAGWRLDGALHANASIGGQFGAPTYTGRIEGAQLVARNFVQGVNVTDGTLAIALQGNTARIERFTAKGGAGTVRLEGDASFDSAPVAHVVVVADKFEMLGRVDRRIVASGRASLRLDKTTLGLDGAFKVDEGLIDVTRADAPTLGDDVEVVRRPPPSAAVAASAKVEAASARPPSLPASSATVVPLAPAARKVALDLRVDMGEALRVRGRGLDAGLRGELHLTSPGGRLAVDGTLRTVDGTYQAYGQKLTIDRGILGFAGTVENPRLDIEATRPDLDVRVGVLVTGSVLEPRIRLFSEPDMSDLDKLSWLVVGRASDTVNGADTALLQRAALALLSGEGPGVTDRITKAIGLDEISVRQGEGEVKDTIVSLGKQISKRWYVGYERGLNATTGSWQLVYRIAQRLTIRAEAGGDNAIDLNWTLRWR